MYVCLCHGVTDRAIRAAADQGARDLSDLAMMTGASTGCGSCGELAQQILDDTRQSRRLPLPMMQMAA